MYARHTRLSDKPARRGCWLYGILFAVGLLILLIVIGILAFTGRERSARSRLNQRLDRLQAQGFPVDHESLQSYYESLTSAEDTDAWLAALDEIASDAFVQSTKGVSGFDGSEIPAPGQLWAEEETTRRFLNKSRQLHGRVMRLSFKQLEDGVLPVRFPLVLKLVPTPPPNTQHLQQAAQLLHLNGRVAVYDRDSKGARRSIESLLGCSEVLTGEPTAISGWVATAIDGMALNVLKLALEFDVLDEGDLVGISRQLLDKATVAPHWQLSIVGERALALPYIEDSSLIARSHSTFASGRSVDALCYLDHADRVLDIRSDDLDEFLVGLRKRESEVGRLRDGILARNDSIVTRMVTIPLSISGNAFVGQATGHRLAALGVGVRLYEKRHGKLPRSLVALVEFKLDRNQLMPPGKKPFGYSVDKHGATLWGFDITQARSTPQTPPPVANGDPVGESNKQWVWKLPAAATDESK